MSYFTTAGAEAVNGIIELHRRSPAYRNPENYRLRMLLVAGGLLLLAELL